MTSHRTILALAPLMARGPMNPMIPFSNNSTGPLERGEEPLKEVLGEQDL